MAVIAFYLLAFLAVAGALLMVGNRNPLGGAFCLVVSLVAIAGLFAMQSAEFVFVLQILVYAGAIMVLVIFTIMLLNLSKEELREAPVHPLRAIIIAALCIAGAAMTIIVFRDFPVAPATLDAGFGSIEAVGKTMLSDFLYPFEVISLVLLVAVVGVVLMAKKEI